MPVGTINKLILSMPKHFLKLTGVIKGGSDKILNVTFNHNNYTNNNCPLALICRKIFYKEAKSGSSVIKEFK